MLSMPIPSAGVRRQLAGIRGVLTQSRAAAKRLDPAGRGPSDPPATPPARPRRDRPDIDVAIVDRGQHTRTGADAVRAERELISINDDALAWLDDVP